MTHIVVTFFTTSEASWKIRGSYNFTDEIPLHDRNLVLRQVALFSATLDVSSRTATGCGVEAPLLSLDSIMQKYDNSGGRWSLLDKCHASPLINPRALVS